MGFGYPAGMKPETQKFLYMMLWGAETLMRPTIHNVFESIEGWASRRGLLRHIRRLEERKLIEPKASGTAERIYRLTETGRLAALGGNDPECRWNRSWDGKWRMVIFDLPEKENASRVRLRRHLKARGFGYLQNSLWISPDPLDKDLKKLSAGSEEVESFLTLEARPCSGESDEAMVSGAWDFQRINRLHQECLRVLKSSPRRKAGEARDNERLLRWASQERAAWQAVLRNDPFLPTTLLPAGYVGQEVWSVRTKVLRQAGEWLQ